METTPPVEGWVDTEYKEFKPNGSETSDSDSDDDSEHEQLSVIKGYKREKYKKILVVEDLIPE